VLATSISIVTQCKLAQNDRIDAIKLIGFGSILLFQTTHALTFPLTSNSERATHTTTTTTSSLTTNYCHLNNHHCQPTSSCTHPVLDCRICSMVQEEFGDIEMSIWTGHEKRSVSILHPPPPYKQTQHQLLLDTRHDSYHNKAFITSNTQASNYKCTPWSTQRLCLTQLNFICNYHQTDIFQILTTLNQG
jgi:hypothetical protein